MMAEMKSARCVIFAIVILQILSLAVVEAAVNSSLSVGDGKGPPSAPRNLRRSVTGITGIDREFRVFWTASKDNGGLPVNYTVKLCWKDHTVCGNSGSPDCLVTNVVSTSKGFDCVLSMSDFHVIQPAGEFSEHDLCVEASNVAGKNETCIHAGVVDAFGGTPRPPLNLSFKLENGQFTVRWEERWSWKQSNLVKKLYTVIYCTSPSKKCKTKVVKDRTIATLTDLEPFTEYCVLLIIQFENEDGKKTVPSDRLGPKCLPTPAGEPSNRPQIVAYKNYLLPENSSVRDVAVEWKSALPSSWKGTPGQFLISCDYHVLNGRESLAEKCKYHTNATANSTILRGLNSGDKYLVFIDKCNEEGKCSGRGRSYLIDAVEGVAPDATKQTGRTPKYTKAQKAGISLSVIFGLASAVIAVYFIRKWILERRDKAPPLAQVYGQVEPGPQHQYYEVHEIRNEYHRVY